MPFPIALGGKSVSAQTLPGPCSRYDENDDGVLLEPLDLYQSQSWGVCPKQEWLVRVTASYYDLLRQEDTNSSSAVASRRDCTMVEVRIQVSPLTRPLSPNYRETSHHLKLSDGAQDEYPRSQPQVVVSEDRRNLAVLLFHPHQQSSTVVIFQLRKPRTDVLPPPVVGGSGGTPQLPSASSPIPLPSYLQKVGNETNESSVFAQDAPAVATHPRFVSLWGISTLCRVPNVSPPVMLAACQDGSLVWLDVRSSMAVAAGTLPLDEEQSGGSDILPLRSMQVSPTSEMDKGALLAVGNNGHAILAQWLVEKTTSMQKTHPKRASTGNLMSSPIRLLSLQSPTAVGSKMPWSRTARTPRRSLSEGLNDGNTLELPFKTPWKNPFLHWLGQEDVSEQEKKQAIQRQEHMREFVLNELRNRTAAHHAWTSAPSIRGTASKLRPRRQRRRQSDTPGRGRLDRTKRSMLLSILSSLEEPVADACFGASSTVVGVVYRAENGHTSSPYHGGGNGLATHGRSRVAQVFSIAETGAWQPMLPLHLSDEQVSHATNFQHKVGTGTTMEGLEGGASLSSRSTYEEDPGASMEGRFGLDYDIRSDTFAISTTFGKKEDHRWIGCLWNWRSNAMGWIVQNSLIDDEVDDNRSKGPRLKLWSRLYFGRHPNQGRHLTYLEARMGDRYLHTRKQVVATGWLSPPPSFRTSLEPCSLLLSRNSMSFPHASAQMSSDVMELTWKVSSLPLTYSNSYGPPQIAAVGRQKGSSVAVASSCGVCILDDKFNWKQFGSPDEEKTFGVLAMAWWEGDNGDGTEDEKEDLLLTIIQSNNGRQYLSCWSPKRLDLSHQLLESPRGASEGSIDTSTAPESPWGIALPKDAKAASLMFLPEPRSEYSNGSRRAVAMVGATNLDNYEMCYTLYQLQTRKVELDGQRPSEYREQQPFSVLARQSMDGILRSSWRSTGPISTMFLAGASFRFDLEETDAQAKASNETEKPVVTLGVVRTPGGLESVSLDSTGRYFSCHVVDSDEVSKYWLADTVRTSGLDGAAESPIDAHVWGIELVNGELFSWSVPILLNGVPLPDEEKQLVALLREAKIPRPKGLYPPTLVCKSDALGTSTLLQHGALCHIGSSSDWMQQSTSGCQTDVALGVVPHSNYGCVLRAGQYSRRIHRSSNGDFDADLFASDFLETEIYGPSELIMAPPAFVPSLYTLFLEAAYLRTEVRAIDQSMSNTFAEMLGGEHIRLKTIEAHIQNRLLTSPNKDAVVMALRLLILRAVEMFSTVDRKHKKHQTDISHSLVVLASALFSEVVDAVRKCTTNLQFASLLLEVGRQIEPSCLPHLFPLPESGKSAVPKTGTDSKNLDKTNARSVLELFSLCIQEGSLAASASALPLLNSRIQSRNYCCLLLARCVENFVRNTDSSEATFDQTLEERRVIGDIFRYGIKLEDAAYLDRRDGHMNTGDDSFPFLEDHDDIGPLSSSISTDSTDPWGSSRNLLCMNGRNSSLLDYIVPSIFSGETVSENAIKQAATTFIEAGNMDMPSMSVLHLEESSSEEEPGAGEENGVGEKEVYNGTSIQIRGLDGHLKSVAGLVAEALLDLLRSPKVDYPWKAMAALARLILPDGRGSIPEPEVLISVAETRGSEATVDFVVPVGYYEGDRQDRLTRSMVVEMGRCAYQVTEQDAECIIGIALHLLHRLTEFPMKSRDDQTKITFGLVVLSMIAESAVATGRGFMCQEIIPQLDTGCLLVLAYEKAKQDAASSV